MSEISKNIVSLIVSKEFHKAKTLIHEAMNNKLGILLEEKLLEYAPTLYEGEDTEYSSAFGGERYNKQRTDEPPLKLSGGIKVDLDRPPVDNVTISGSDATSSDSIDNSHAHVKTFHTPATRSMGFRRSLKQSVPLTIDQFPDISSPDEESPVADRIYDTGAAAANVARAAWLAQKTGFFASGGLAPFRPWVSPKMIAKSIPGANAAGQAVMTAVDIATNPDWRKGKKLQATAATAKDIARTGVRTLALYPVTGIPGILSVLDQQLNDGRATDAVTDALIQGPQDWLDNMGFGNDLTDPVAVKKYNNSLTSKIWPLTTAAEDAKRLDAERKVARDLRRRGVTQQDIEKPEVAAGTVRTGSGQVMQK